MCTPHDEITASNLVTIDLDGTVIDPGSATSDEDINVTGFVIHSAIHAARPDLHCVMHSHAEAGLAVSVLKEGLLTMIQDGMPFHKQVAYHDYEGLSTDVAERERLAASLGDKRVMILRNHGAITVGQSIKEALFRTMAVEEQAFIQWHALVVGEPD